MAQRHSRILLCRSIGQKEESQVGPKYDMYIDELLDKIDELMKLIEELLSNPSNHCTDAVDTEDGYTLTPKRILHRRARKLLQEYQEYMEEE